MIIKKNNFVLGGLIFLEISLLGFIFLYLLLPYTGHVIALVNSSNVTVVTMLQVGEVNPEVINVTINNYASGIDLVANSSVTVNVTAIVRDYNGEGDIANMTGRFFDIGASAYGSAADNNNHYRNESCSINYAYGDSYYAEATCQYSVRYYANNATWNGSITVTDNTTRSAGGSDLISINTLLALGLPQNINYGMVNSSEVSGEITVNVTNYGNSLFNLTISGYARTPNDGFAMNCSLGYLENISIDYEKYNVSGPNSATMNLAAAEGNYTNLSSTPAIKRFDLNFRQNDTNDFIDDTNATYWRIFVPIGVAGNCTGNVVFGAVKGTGS